MLPGLLVINIVVWLAAIAYLLQLIPPARRFWNLWAGLGALLCAILLSAVSYRTVQSTRVREQASKYYHAGIDEKQRGNLQQAEQDFQRAIALNPGDPNTRQQLESLRTEQHAEHREQTKATEIAPVPSQRAPSSGSSASSGAPANTPANTPPANAPASNVPPTPKPGQVGQKVPPAAHKPSPFEITHYALQVKLDPAAHTLDATATIRVRSRGERVPKLDFSLDPAFTPTAAQVDGVPVPFQHTHDLVTLAPKKPLTKDREQTVAVTYGHKGEAVIKGGAGLIAKGGSYFLSECRWYPATGELDFRSPVQVDATVPTGYTVVSVGRLKGKDVSGKETTFHWGTDRLASMVSLACAKYVEKAIPVRAGGSDDPAGLKVTCYTFPQHANRADAFLKEAAAAVRFYQSKFGPYPYEKLGVVEIPLFPGGYGTTSFVMLIDKSFEEKRVDREFLSHEIAHQWWGNSVFPQGMGAAWLTEAFANYSAWMYDSSVQGNPRVLQKRVAQATAKYFAEIGRLGDQPIAETDPYLQVGAREEIIYEKGAVVLHMLRRQIGDAAFFNGMRQFADQFHFGKAKIEDFRKVMESASGQQLGWFFDQWLGRAGGMELTYSFTTERDTPTQNQAVLTVTQPKPAYRGKMKVLLDVENSPQTEEIELTGEQNTFRFPVKGKVTSVLLDPEGIYLMRPPMWFVPDKTASR